MKVFINCGHCVGIDSGSINRNLNVTEAQLVLDIGNILYDILIARGYEVLLEQSDNVHGEKGYTWEDSICCHANEWEADIFVSIHTNAYNCSVRGTEVWYFSIAGGLLADYIQTELIEALDFPDRRIKHSSKYWVLQDTSMPACIVEVGFIDNDMECREMLDKKESAAYAIANGIDKYFR